MSFKYPTLKKLVTEVDGFDIWYYFFALFERCLSPILDFKRTLGVTKILTQDLGKLI